jgi:hypothetical protein
MIPSPSPVFQFFKSDGTPAAGYKIRTYLAGTTTDAETYQDASGNTLHTNPIELDVNGSASIFINPAVSYKYVLTTAAGAVVDTWDNVQTYNPGSVLNYDQETVTIASGTATITKAIALIDTEAAAASDDLTSLAKTTVSDGDIAYISSVNAARDVTVKHGTSLNNISTRTAADYVLAPGVYMMLRRDGGVWREMTTVSEKPTDPIQPITATVGSNALTVTLNPTTLDFRSATLSDGAVSTEVISSAISLTVPTTATLGTINATSATLVIAAMRVAGVGVELAIASQGGGLDTRESVLITTTSMSTGSTSANTWYSTTGRTSMPFRVVGIVQLTQATAGTWATAPSLVQGMGGTLFGTLSQRAWQDVTGSRIIGTIYYNTTGRDIVVAANGYNSSAPANIILTVAGVVLSGAYGPTSGTTGSQWVVPSGASYVLSGITNLSSWRELR